jgi:hypothetical protein
MPRENVVGDGSGVNLGEDVIPTIKISCGMLRCNALKIALNLNLALMHF